MRKTFPVVGTVLFAAMFSMASYAQGALDDTVHPDDNGGLTAPSAGAATAPKIDDNPHPEDNGGLAGNAKPEDNPHPEDNLGVSTDDCPGGGRLGIGGTIDASSGTFDVHARHDDCVREQEAQPGDDKRLNGTVTANGTFAPNPDGTIKLNFTRSGDTSITNDDNDFKLSCTQKVEGDFDPLTNKLHASSVTVTCTGAGTIQEKRLDDAVLNVIHP